MRVLSAAWGFLLPLAVATAQAAIPDAHWGGRKLLKQ